MGGHHLSIGSSCTGETGREIHAVTQSNMGEHNSQGIPGM